MIGVGVDFGTSNSAAAWYDGQRVHLVDLEATSAIMPTATHLDRELVTLTGEAAVAQYIDENRDRIVGIVLCVQQKSEKAEFDLPQRREAGTGVADDLYRQLGDAGVDVLYDDRDERPGVKFADAELIGIPWQVVIGPRGVKDGVVELKSRSGGDAENLPPADLLARFGAAG